MATTSLNEAVVPRPQVTVESRSTEVGGVPVVRALPRPTLRTVGAWCLVDRFGPTDASVAPMLVPPHPHIGLHTVTWLFSGELVHRDSLGNELSVRPGQVNVMTAGRGISHSEETPASTTGPLDGFQLWVAQPSSTRDGRSAFRHHAEVPEVGLGPRATGRVIVGGDAGFDDAPTVDSALIGIDVSLIGDARIPLEPAFEHAVVVASGQVAVGGRHLTTGRLLYVPVGATDLPLESRSPARLLILGGPPFEEQLFMWWNFVARSQDEIDDAWYDWQTDSGRFGAVGSPLPRLKAPMPSWRKRDRLSAT